MEAKDKMIEIIKSKTTDILKESAMLLKNDLSDGANTSFVFILNELEERMPDTEYIEFCESL